MMSDANQVDNHAPSLDVKAQGSSKTPNPPTHGPDNRSRYEKNVKMDLSTEVRIGGFSGGIFTGCLPFS